MSDEHKRKIGLANSVSQKGKKHSEKTKRKMSKAQKGKGGYWEGKKMTKEHRDNIGKAHKGMKMSKTHREKLRKANLGRKSNFWKGGIWKNKYPVEWTETLRRSIRERDNYTCKLCSKQQGDVAHCVHHIDYNKNNCNPNNLVTLCKRCHSKTGTKRVYWKEFFRIINIE